MVMLRTLLWMMLAGAVISSAGCGIGAIGAGHCSHEQLKDPANWCDNR